MKQHKKVETVYTYWFKASVYAPLIFLIFLAIQAYKEKTLSIFGDFWWIIILISALIIPLEALSRGTKIDYEHRTITIKDGFLNIILIKSDTKVKIDNDTLIYTKPSEAMESKFYFIGYNQKDRKKIINSILEFNPNVER